MAITHHAQPLTGQCVVLTVLGARSGTSVMAGLLGLLGAALPNRLMPANWANPKGYFEPVAIANTHDELLSAIGSSWDDSRAVPSEFFASSEGASWAEHIAGLYRMEYGNAPLSVLKEPRICRLLPLWRRVFTSVNAVPAFVFVDRSPIEVAASLAARDRSTVEHGFRYYIRNKLDAERYTRGMRRVVVSYSDLLGDWRSVVGKVETALGVTLPGMATSATDVDAFVDRSLRHQNQTHSESNARNLAGIAFAIHDAFRALGRDPECPAALAELDQQLRAFQTMENV